MASCLLRGFLITNVEKSAVMRFYRRTSLSIVLLFYIVFEFTEHNRYHSQHIFYLPVTKAVRWNRIMKFIYII